MRIDHEFRLTNRKPSRAGYTLVEMLVAVGLVLLLMSLFAQVFSTATGSMSQQRGIGENDQRVRMLTTLLESDIQHRTFRDVVPFPKEFDTSRLPSRLMERRRGYFSISENDPLDDTDDVLRLTILSSMPNRSGDTSPFFGVAQNLGSTFNQPEADDAIPGNSVGSSIAAEVVWFLRRGNLYRRISLIRDKNFDEAQPVDTSTPPRPLIYNSYTHGSGEFLRDFDYSAFFQPQVGGGEAFGPRFLSVDALDNHSHGQRIDLGGTAANVSLGLPFFRFGFSPNAGLPREYANNLRSETGSTTSGSFFMGSYTHEETSHSAFDYPGLSVPPGSHPMDRTDLTLNEVSGSIEQYENGPRKGADILLPNVFAMDIEVWDPAASTGPDSRPGVYNYDDDANGTEDDNSELGWPGSDDGAWRDLGHGTLGFYSSTSNPTFGNRYDTWHPTLVGDPPFRPVTTGIDNEPGLGEYPPGSGNGYDDDGVNGANDPDETGMPGTDDEIPLTAIRITFRVFDVSSGILRDVTLIHSLRDK